MDMKQLQSFAAVVTYQSFTKAAEKLYLSQPTISTHIRLLEEELHSCLIIRTKRTVEVTPRGQELYECARDILSLRDNLIRRWTEEKNRTIQLGASTIPSAYILPEILPDYGRLHPEVYFTIHQSDSQGVADGILNGSFDLGLAGMEIDHEQLACVPFYQDRMVLITPVSPHFLAMKEQEEVPLDSLLREPIILREQGSGSRKSAQRFLDSAGIREEELNVTARINDQESIKNLVAGGLGVSILSERAARNFAEEKRVLLFELPESTSRRYLYLLFRKNFILKSYIQAFCDHIKKRYAPTLGQTGRLSR